MNKKRLEELIELYVSEIKDLPKIEKETAYLLKRLDVSFKGSGGWKEDYQTLSEIENTGRKVLETLTPLTDIPVGVGDSFLVLRATLGKAKEKLSTEKSLDEKELSTIDINRKSFISHVKNFARDMEGTERKNMRRIIGVMDENYDLKKKILELQFENEKLRRKLERS
jgi:hypothetical protein